MNVVYISKTDEIDEILGKWEQKLPLKLKKKISKNKVNLQREGENIICKIYINNKIKEKDLKKIGQNIRSKIKVNEYTNIVASKDIKTNQVIFSELKEFNILNGRWLFNYLIYDIIQYIMIKKGISINESEISILVEDTKDANIQNILKIAENVKILNIVTNNISIFKQIEDKLYEEKGIMIRVTNNKKKSLLKSDIIINLDLDENELIKYNVPNKGIIVNVNKEIRKIKKSFSGINVNGYNIEIPDKYKKENFDDREIYESAVYCKTQFQNVIARLNEDNIKIISLNGNNGIIDESEYRNLK